MIVVERQLTNSTCIHYKGKVDMRREARIRSFIEKKSQGNEANPGPRRRSTFWGLSINRTRDGRRDSCDTLRLSRKMDLRKTGGG